MITYQVEKISDIKDEMTPLLDNHYDELTLHKEVVKLSVDWERYLKMDEAGALFNLTVRDSGKLVGYSVFYVQQHMHYTGLKMAKNDVLFLAKEYRKGPIGIKIIKRCEKELAEIGVQKIVWHAKQSNYLGELLVLLGYGVEDVILGKILESNDGI